MNPIHRRLQGRVTLQSNRAQSLYTSCYQLRGGVDTILTEAQFLLQQVAARTLNTLSIHSQLVTNCNPAREAGCTVDRVS